MSQTRLITADDFMAMGGDRYCELIRGQVVDMVRPCPQHGILMARVSQRLLNYMDQGSLGFVLDGDPGYLIERDPDTVRGPDVSFVSRKRVKGVDLRRFFPGAPDLAIEIVSPSDRFAKVEEKVQMWLATGTTVVWVIEPDLRLAFVYREGEGRREIQEDGHLTADDLLPGFRLSLRDLLTISQ